VWKGLLIRSDVYNQLHTMISDYAHTNETEIPIGVTPIAERQPQPPSPRGSVDNIAGVDLMMIFLSKLMHDKGIMQHVDNRYKYGFFFHGYNETSQIVYQNRTQQEYNAVAQVSSAPKSKSYLGCFLDEQARTMDLDSIHSDSMTIELCTSFCRYLIFAVHPTHFLKKLSQHNKSFK
jgi:hypothetical protein